jgi:hypothetical protein
MARAKLEIESENRWMKRQRVLYIKCKVSDFGLDLGFISQS